MSKSSGACVSHLKMRDNTGNGYLFDRFCHILFILKTCPGESSYAFKPSRAATTCPSPERASAKPRFACHHAGRPSRSAGLIKSVNLKTCEVVIVYKHDGSTHTYKIDFATPLGVNNSADMIADVKPGMVVDDYAERSNDTLDSLSVSDSHLATRPTQRLRPRLPDLKSTCLISILYPPP